MKTKVVFLLSILCILLVGCSSDDNEITGEVVYDTEPEDEVVVVAPEPEPVEVEEEPEEEIVTVKLCHDTDKGNIRWESGRVFGFYDNASSFEFTDYCQNNNRMMEFYCDEEDPKQESFFCRNGCENGACK